jgi:hypothetical protein
MVKKVIGAVLVFDLLALLTAVALRLFVRSRGDARTETFTRAMILRGERFASQAEPLRHGSVVAFMGGLELDLTDAQPAAGAELTLLTVWGGTEVQIPPGWRVIHDSTTILGNTQFVLDGADELPDDAPSLTVNSRTVMGAMVLTNRTRPPTD